MRLHLKLMALLAVFGLLPTLVVGLYGRGALDALGSDLAERGRAAFTARVTEGLTETVAQAAAVLDFRRMTLEMTVRTQAAEVGRLLTTSSASSPATEAGDITLPADIVSAEAPPPGARSSPAHGVAVSSDVLALTIADAPDVDVETVVAQARALAPLRTTLASLSTTIDAGVLWQFVITADGLALTWPAAEPRNAPDMARHEPPSWGDGDPRLLPWFAHALETGAPVWTAPHIDPASGRLALTAGMPVLNNDGRVVAVTGLHVDVMASARVLQEQADLPRGTTGMLVMPWPLPKEVAKNAGTIDETAIDTDAAPGLRLLARGAVPAKDRAVWQPPTTANGEALPPSPERDAMAEALAEGSAGTIRMPYQGVPAVWAYGALPGAGGVGVIYVVPLDRLSAMTEGIATMVRSATKGHLAATGSVVLGILALSVAGAWIGARQVARPLRALGAAMERVAAGDLTVRAPVASRDEVGDAARRFNEMVPLLEDRLGLRQALDLAQDVQQALLPKSAPTIAGFDVAGASVYSDETGGDYFDYVPTTGPSAPAGRWAIMVGDVTGHGVSAALLMTTIRAMLRARAGGVPDPAALLQSVNPLLAEDVSAGRFVTLFCLFLDSGQREISWSSAGHGGCLLYDPANGTLEPLEGDDIPLGVDAGWRFAPSRRRTLAPGQILLLGTDGLLEARDASGREFGTMGLHAAVTAARGGDADRLCQSVLDACATHRQGAAPTDDTTLVVVRKL